MITSDDIGEAGDIIGRRPRLLMGGRAMLLPPQEVDVTLDGHHVPKDHSNEP